MNNEEKILSILETVVTRLDKLDAGQARLETDMAEVKADVTGLKTDMVEVKTELSAVKKETTQTRLGVVHIESDHGQMLGALFDGYKLNRDLIQEIKADLAEHDAKNEAAHLLLQASVSAVERATKTNTQISSGSRPYSNTVKARMPTRRTCRVFGFPIAARKA